MQAQALFRRIFSVESMLPAEKRQGDVPGTKEAYKDVMRIAVPSITEMVLMSLVGMIDTMMVGSLGPAAIAAVGLTGQPRMLILCIFLALNIGVTAVVARRKGQGLQGKANEALRNALVLIAIISVVLMAIALPLAGPMMWLAGAKEDTIGLATQYFVIISSVLPLNAITLCINAAQRGVGNTRVTMYVNILSNVVNIVLNWLLINGNLGFPKLGVQGAAIATMIGFIAGFLLSLYSVVSRRSVGRFLHLSVHSSWRLQRDSIKAITKVGGNAMLEQLALRIGFFIYARLVADLGTMAFAAHQVCMQFINISFSCGDGVGVAGTSLVGQMMGRERSDLATLYGKVSQRIAMLFAFAIAAVVIIFRYQLVSLFTSDTEVIALAAQVMLMVAAFQPFQMSSVVIAGCLRGAGDTRYVAIVMLVFVGLVRPTLASIGIYVIGLGLLGAWSASLIDMSLRVVFVYRRFHSGKWCNIKI